MGKPTNQTVKIQDVIQLLEQEAPLAFQANYDNCGLLVGNKDFIVKGVMIALDVTEELIEEAIARNCNLIVVHHPFLFKAIKTITGKNWIERCVIKAIKNDIAIYAAHTNADHVAHGVNFCIGQRLGIENAFILSPEGEILQKLITFVPPTHLNQVANALFEQGAGHIGNYSEASFFSKGTGTYKAIQGANPFLGQVGVKQNEEEYKLEVVYPKFLQQKIVQALLSAHPYEEVAYDILNLANKNKHVGGGMYAKLANEISEQNLLALLKDKFGAKCIKHSSLLHKPIHTLAWCGGAGIGLLPNAKAVGAQAFITSDVKYHDFFEADNEILIIDIGHFESEQFTVEVFFEWITRKFTNFATYLAENVKNPVNYYL